MDLGQIHGSGPSGQLARSMDLGAGQIPDPWMDLGSEQLGSLVHNKLYTRDPMNMTTTIVDGTMTLTYWT